LKVNFILVSVVDHVLNSFFIVVPPQIQAEIEFGKAISTLFSTVILADHYICRQKLIEWIQRLFHIKKQLDIPS
jgi:hypothetical protein